MTKANAMLAFFLTMAILFPLRSLTASEAKLIRVLIVTGADYPGHPWYENSQAMRRALVESGRFDVRVSEDVEILATPVAERYDAVVLNYCNWEAPSPRKQVLDGLADFVRGGKGLVVIHFSCGAFPDWPEYAKLIGRVWDRVKTHDPYGSFRVRAVDKQHPITRKLDDFDITDELYFCLTGDAEVKILLTARSQVTGKDEPMGFVLQYGKGRVFHTPLGHDLKSVASPGFIQLLRRACEWAATGNVTD